ncbi:MAG: thermonuclease family protein [Halobacteriaceae archaeon]
MQRPSTPTDGRTLACLATAVALLALSGCTVDVSLSPGTTGNAGDADQGGTLGPTTVTVTHVVDADTLEVRFPDGSTDTVRLLGVDVPETRAENTPGEYEGVPDTAAGRDWLAAWGTYANRWAERCLDGATVELAGDPLADRRGDYGRLLAYVTVDGTSFNRALLERGFARLYDSSFERRDEFVTVEAEAQAAERGLWGYGSGDAPPTGVGETATVPACPA